jgi:hypothetical protein
MVGTVLAPILLPWIPERAFALRRTLVGIVAVLAVAAKGCQFIFI